MARGSDQATGAATSAQNLSNAHAADASSLYGTLAPELESEMAHPAGIDPTNMARMDTGAMETAGGANAAAAGAAGLRAARTRNVGGGDAAIAESSRRAAETLSRATLGNRVKNEEIKQGERKSAQSGLEGLYGLDTGASVNSLGEVAQNVNADTNAANASWDWSKYLLEPAMQAASNSKYF